MNDSHKFFLQAFMSRGILGAKEVKQLFKIACQKFGENIQDGDTKSALMEFVQTVNHHIDPFHMKIKKGISEDDGSSLYGLVCTNESAITKLASDYSANELEFFKKLIECVVNSEDGDIGSVAALNLTTRLDKKMSKDDAQDLLHRLERARWIRQSQGHISLETRSLLELDQYILEMYPDDAEKCNACNKLCLKGQICKGCGTKLHNHCAHRFFHGKENARCPNKDCGMRWMYDLPTCSTEETESSQAASLPDSTSRKRKARS